MTICVLGRQPELGLAELESLYGSKNIRPVGENCALVDGPVDFSRLGGSVKTAQLLASLPGATRQTIFKKIAQLLPAILKTLPQEGKIKLGLSVHGLDISPYELGGEALRLKKLLRKQNRSVRVVPNESAALSSAQTYHNHLTGDLGLEFVIVHDGEQAHISRVTHVQNIDSYRIRDRERPKRDAFVGMLPPKLAQIIINLATGEKHLPATILDPFCGTGVILQEALLMGYRVYGSDISQKMIDYSNANVSWLLEGKKIETKENVRLEVADATDHIWRQPITTVIACEGYLGQPLGGQRPTLERLQSIIHDTNTIMRGFLSNIAPQLAPDARICIAMPAWIVNDTTHHLPVIKELASLGYEPINFTHAPAPLLYYRDGQITARELVVLRKI